ncbi:MAG TPA: prepilin peptidase [Gemmatimonadaceae bacterium]
MSANALAFSIEIAVLAPLLGWACASDVRSRRIPNAAVVAIAITGIAASLLLPPPSPSLLGAAEGMGVGLAVWLPFYALGMLGAGDVKLFAAAGAWLGPRGALEGAVLAALAGGALALGFMLLEGGTAVTLLKLRSAIRAPESLRDTSVSRASRLPYALAMSAGVIGAAYFPGLL